MKSKFRTCDLAVELYEKCDKIKAKAYIRDQMMRAALSVVLNITEGAAKSTEKERCRFYNIAYASIKEVQILLKLQKREQEFKLADHLGGCLYRLQHPKPHT